MSKLTINIKEISITLEESAKNGIHIIKADLGAILNQIANDLNQKVTNEPEIRPEFHNNNQYKNEIGLANFIRRINNKFAFLNDRNEPFIYSVVIHNSEGIDFLFKEESDQRKFAVLLRKTLKYTEEPREIEIKIFNSKSKELLWVDGFCFTANNKTNETPSTPKQDAKKPLFNAERYAKISDPVKRQQALYNKRLALKKAGLLTEEINSQIENLLNELKKK